MAASTQDLDLFAQSFDEFRKRQSALTEKIKFCQVTLDNTFKQLDDAVSSNNNQQQEFARLEKILNQISKDAKESGQHNEDLERVSHECKFPLRFVD